jgi:thiol-disulfide isomerase/thioredoxin
MIYKINYYNYMINKQSGGGGNKTAILFKADWCGHCKNFDPIWNKVQKTSSNIKFVKYDLDKNPNEVNEYDVKSVPRIFLKTDKETYEYFGKRDEKSLKHFLNLN